MTNEEMGGVIMDRDAILGPVDFTCAGRHQQNSSISSLPLTLALVVAVQ